jgi:hypothetical protein
MAETTLSLKGQLEAAEAEIAKIEAITDPLYAELSEAWGPVEKARAKYNALKEKHLAVIRKAQGAYDEQIMRQPTLPEMSEMIASGKYKPGDPIPLIPDSAPSSRLHELKKAVAGLRRAGAHR